MCVEGGGGGNALSITDLFSLTILTDTGISSVGKQAMPILYMPSGGHCVCVCVHVLFYQENTIIILEMVIHSNPFQP